MAGDRLVKPLLGTLEYGLPSDHLQEGIAAALHYRNEDDPQAVELQAMLAELGPARTLARVTGLDEHSDVSAFLSTSAVPVFPATVAHAVG